MYRNNVNIGDLINRFEVTNEDDFDMSENVKYVGSPSFVRKYNRRQSGDESFGSGDENRSLVKAYAKSNTDKFVDSTVFVRRSNMSMSGAKEFIKQVLHRISALLEMISKFPFPRMSVMSFGLTALIAVFIAPRSFTEKVIYPAFKILFTIIYPAYRSFKAVRNKNIKEYLKWLVYWIVYSFFSCFEMVSDALLNWFPFYYEIKVIFLIWLLGPSSRGSMKLYKNCIHPMLISREQDIDDAIQLAQDHGYMQVFRLSSKSVNYANRIIMQETKADNSFIVSHQLMQNMSLSNLSDVGAIQSNDSDDNILNMRRYSLEKMPMYGSNQGNYPYENIDSRRRASYDYKYDDMMSSGYSSPITSYHRYPIKQHQQNGAFIEDPELTQYKPDNNKSFNQPSPRKASVSELTDDEIILAYHKLQQERNLEKAVEAKEDMKNAENYHEFLKWMEDKRSNEKATAAAVSTIKENDVPKAKSSHHHDEKVKTKDDDFSVSKCLDDDEPVVGDVGLESVCEKPNVTGCINEIEHSEFVDVKHDDKEVDDLNVQQIAKDSVSPMQIVEDSIHPQESKAVEIANDVEIFNNPHVVEDSKTESDPEVDFAEFKDVISESDEEDEALKVPLVIKEENEIEPEAAKKEDATAKETENKSTENEETAAIEPEKSENALIPTVVEENFSKVENATTVKAKFTLTNAPLKIETKFSASSISLASSADGAENKAKRPARHTKGRAPPPPPSASTSSGNVIEGYFYDELTQKHFRETEL